MEYISYMLIGCYKEHDIYSQMIEMAIQIFPQKLDSQLVSLNMTILTNDGNNYGIPFNNYKSNLNYFRRSTPTKLTCILLGIQLKSLYKLNQVLVLLKTAKSEKSLETAKTK